MNRFSLVALGLVVALGIALFVMTRSQGSDAKEKVPDRPAATSAPPAPRTGVASRPDRPTLRVESGDPGSDPQASEVGADSTAQAREYVNRQGVLVRDHRGGEGSEFNSPSTERPGQKKKLEPRVVEGVRENIHDSVRKCREHLDYSTFGDKPSAQAEVILSIREGQVSTDRTGVKFRDVPEAQGDEMRDCMQASLGSMAFDAAGHEDISEYRVTLVFPLRD